MEKKVSVRLKGKELDELARLGEELNIPSDSDVLRKGLNALAWKTRAERILRAWGVDINKLIEKVET